MDDDFEEVIPIINSGGKAEQKIKPSVSMDEREKRGEEEDEIDEHGGSVHVSCFA